MNRQPAQYLDNITASSEQWLRRCNGYPKAGIPISRRKLRVVLASSANVIARPNGVICWLGGAGQFTAEPVRGAQEGR